MNGKDGGHWFECPQLYEMGLLDFDCRRIVMGMDGGDMAKQIMDTKWSPILLLDAQINE